MKLDVLGFEIDRQRYGIPVDVVLEVVRAVAVAHLPAAPHVIEGVIDYRGRLLPVFGVRTRFRHAPRVLDSSEHFIIARAGERLVALRVDRALDVLKGLTVESPAESVPATTYVAGLASTPDGIIVIHDPAAFLSEGESDAMERALSDGEAAPK